ncbi:MAG: hypothetical protein ACI4RA_03815 [Kiritimatiellia bacterium]
MRKLLLVGAASFLFAANAYLPPVEERAGVKVEIGSFPQKTERPGTNPYAWPLGVAEVKAGAPRAFPVVLENTTDKAVTGTLEVWMNDDWVVTGGEQGTVTLGPKERKELTFTGTSKPSALNALYPVHARFTPIGVKATEAPHPIAVFMYKNPDAPRSIRKTGTPKLGAGVFRLDNGFTRTSVVEVKGKVHALPENGAAPDWGGGMMKGRLSAGGIAKDGFNSHPPYRKGAGFLWSDFPLTLPKETPIAFSCSNFLVSPGDQPPFDGVEYKVFVLEEGKAPQEVCSHIVTKPLTWQDLAGDLTPWAGKAVTLRLWTGPGPKMDTRCDGGGWGDVKLLIGPQPVVPTEEIWQVREAQAVAAATSARTAGTDAAAGRWRLDAGDLRYGAGVAYGARGLIDGALAFTDGEKSVVFRGFTVDVKTEDGSAAPEAKAEIREEGGTLRIKWSIPGVARNARGFPRIDLISVGPASERLFRVYAGFGNVMEKPESFTLNAGGFALSTRHVGADYANGLSVVQAVDVPPDRLVCDGATRRFSLQAHHDALFTFVPSAKGSFEAARRFRAVSGYRKSPGLDRLGARMCLDQWSGDYARAAEGIEKAAKYGLTDSIFVKHVWQCWGYDYRLPEIYPPSGDVAAFGALREACRAAGILFCPHDNYTDIYPDAENYSYDLVVFNLDGTPQRAWFNPGRHAQSYRWAPHAFHPWCLRNAKLLKEGYDPDAVFIDVLTAHGPFDYLDRAGRFHTKMETSASWAKGFEMYREGFRRPDTVCVSEAGQDHLVGCADAGQSDHFGAAKIVGGRRFADAERTPWHDIVTHGYYVLFAGGLGGRYQEEDGWHKGGDAELHGYASDDYLANCIIGGRNPMCGGPFGRSAVKTYWLQHDACAELGAAEFLDLRFGANIHCQHAMFSNGGEVWMNRQTNAVWTLPNGVTLPAYGYYAKTPGTTSGIVEKNGVRCAYSKTAEMDFYDARKPARGRTFGAISSALRAEPVSKDCVRLVIAWETRRPLSDYRPFVHICSTDGSGDGIVFQSEMGLTQQMREKPGVYEVPILVRVPAGTAAGRYMVRYGAWKPKGDGGRLTIGGGRNDGGSRICGGEIQVAAEAGTVTGVTWKPDDTPDAQTARDRLLGVNRAGVAVDFGGVKTDGSFRLAHPKTGPWMVTPLVDSDAFSVELDLAALGAAERTVAGVEPVEPEVAAGRPTWRQEGAKVSLAVDAKAFAYRILFK